MKMKGLGGGVLAGVYLGKIACNLVGVAVGVDIPTGVELVSEVGLGYGLGVRGAQAGAELDWRRKVEAERQERDIDGTTGQQV